MTRAWWCLWMLGCGDVSPAPTVPEEVVVTPPVAQPAPLGVEATPPPVEPTPRRALPRRVLTRRIPSKAASTPRASVDDGRDDFLSEAELAVLRPPRGEPRPGWGNAWRTEETLLELRVDGVVVPLDEVPATMPPFESELLLRVADSQGSETTVMMGALAAE